MLKPSCPLIAHIYKVAGIYKLDARSDVDLIRHYAETQDETAFSALLARHGGMVWNTCRRHLRNTEDAEEAFQNTFLALAGKADKIRVNQTLVGWLQHVAHQTALAARRKEKTRHELQKDLKDHTSREPSFDVFQQETCEALHDEIAKLPEKTRVAVLLHYMEGKTQSEVAEILGIREASVWERLERAKAILKKRLSQRGLAMGAAGLGATLLATLKCSTDVSVVLAQQTVKAATAFRTGILADGPTKIALAAMRHVPAATPCWKNGWMVFVLYAAGLSAAAAGVAWKLGYFNMKAGGSLSMATCSYLTREQGKQDVLRVDVYGDPLPRGALARLGTVRFRPPGDHSHSRIVATSDKKLFIPAKISRYDNYSLQCLDLLTGKVALHFQDAQGTQVKFDTRAALSFDGRLLAQSKGPRGKRVLWDLAQGKVLEIGPYATRSDLLAISPTGESVAVGSIVNHRTEELEISVFNNVTKKRSWHRTLKLTPRSPLVYSSNGKTLMVACSPEFRAQHKPHELVVRQWDVSTGEELQTWSIVAEAGPDPCTWSHDGDTLAVNPELNGDTICIWDAITGKEIQRLRFCGPVQIGSTALSNDGRMLAAVAPESDHKHVSLTLWNTRTGKLLRKWASPHPPTRLAFSKNDAWLVTVSASPFVCIWDVGSGQMVNQVWSDRGHTDEVGSLACSPQADGWASANHEALIQWAAYPKTDAYSIFQMKHFPDKLCLRQVPLSTISHNGKLAACRDFMWGTLWGENQKNLPIKQVFPLALKLSPDNKVLALYGIKRSQDSIPGSVNVYLFNATTGECLEERNTHFDENGDIDGCLAFSPDGKYLAIGGTGGENTTAKHGFHLWDLAAHKVVATKSLGRVSDIVFSVDGCTLAVASEDGNGCHGVSSWRVRKVSGSVSIEGGRSVLAAPEGVAICSLCLSPDLRTIAGILRPTNPLEGENTDDRQKNSSPLICVWEMATGRARFKFDPCERWVACLEFSCDGRRLASGHGDGTILIWDLTSNLGVGKFAAARFGRLSVGSAE